MARPRLFDVVSFDANGNAIVKDLAGVSLADAMKRARGINADPEEHSPAIVLPSHWFTLLKGYAEEIDSITANGFYEQDDSEATEDTPHAADANVAPSVFSEVRARRAKYIQRELRKQLKRIWDALHLVEISSDIGVIAASLEALAKAVDGVEEPGDPWENFDYGQNGDVRHDELEAALGVVRY